MLARERQNAIVDQVNREGSVRVKELSEQFEVTEDSIRKDLTLLEKKGLLKKTYGGAMKVRVNVHDHYVSQRIGKNLPDKQAIARKALSLIQDGDVIFLDISTVNLELAKLLIEENPAITVVTNMIDIMLAFTVQSRMKVIFLGGTFSEGKDGFVGALTNEEIRRFHFDKAFLGVVGVNLPENSVATYTAEDATTKSAVLKSSSKAYMMLESRKLSANGNYIYANADEFAGVILEKEPDSTAKKWLKKYELEWFAE